MRLVEQQAGDPTRGANFNTVGVDRFNWTFPDGTITLQDDWNLPLEYWTADTWVAFDVPKTTSGSLVATPYSIGWKGRVFTPAFQQLSFTAGPFKEGTQKDFFPSGSFLDRSSAAYLQHGTSMQPFLFASPQEYLASAYVVQFIPTLFVRLSDTSGLLWVEQFITYGMSHSLPSEVWTDRAVGVYPLRIDGNRVSIGVPLTVFHAAVHYQRSGSDVFTVLNYDRDGVDLYPGPWCMDDPQSVRFIDVHARGDVILNVTSDNAVSIKSVPSVSALPPRGGTGFEFFDLVGPLWGSVVVNDPLVSNEQEGYFQDGGYQTGIYNGLVHSSTPSGSWFFQVLSLGHGNSVLVHVKPGGVWETFNLASGSKWFITRSVVTLGPDWGLMVGYELPKLNTGPSYINTFADPVWCAFEVKAGVLTRYSLDAVFQTGPDWHVFDVADFPLGDFVGRLLVRRDGADPPAQECSVWGFPDFTTQYVDWTAVG